MGIRVRQLQADAGSLRYCEVRVRSGGMPTCPRCQPFGSGLLVGSPGRSPGGRRWAGSATDRPVHTPGIRRSFRDFA
jgi:hypothetical protein